MAAAAVHLQISDYRRLSRGVRRLPAMIAESRRAMTRRRGKVWPGSLICIRTEVEMLAVTHLVHRRPLWTPGRLGFLLLPEPVDGTPLADLLSIADSAGILDRCTVSPRAGEKRSSSRFRQYLSAFLTLTGQREVLEELRALMAEFEQQLDAGAVLLVDTEHDLSLLEGLVGKMNSRELTVSIPSGASPELIGVLVGTADAGGILNLHVQIRN